MNIPISAVKFFYAFLLLTIALPLSANEYTPEGFYDVDRMVFENGFELVLKHRPYIPSVSMRLKVNVGMKDYPCGKQETPHFLEHLVFAGTSTHTEAELNALIEDNGGRWNAYTGQHETVYDIDIHSHYADLALNLLYEMMTDSTLSQENIDLSREILLHEMGGTPSRFSKWIYEMELYKSGSDMALDFLGLNCREIDTAETVTPDDIKQAFRKHYVPNNMQLVVVGDYDKTEIIQQVSSSFGALPRAQIDGRPPTTLPEVNGPLIFTGSLYPLASNQAQVTLLFPVEGHSSPDRALKIIRNYLSTRLYNALRIEKGLTYTPRVSVSREQNYGLFYLIVNTKEDDLEKVQTIISNEIQKLIDGEIAPEVIESIKRSILLAYSQGFESNAGHANYYVNSLYEFDLYESLFNEESAITKVTPEDVTAAAKKYLSPENQITIIHDPIFTFSGLLLFIATLVLGIGILVIYLFRKRFLKFRR